MIASRCGLNHTVKTTLNLNSIQPKILNNSQPVNNDLKPNGVLLFDFCGNHSLSIMNATFKYKSIHKCTWHQETLSLRLMIEFVIGLSDLHAYVLDTWVKRGAEVSAAGENTGQDWHIKMWIVRMCWPRSTGSSTPTSDRTLEAFWQRLGTLSLNGPSSAALLQRWLEAVCYALLCYVLAVISRWWTLEVKRAVKLEKWSCWTWQLMWFQSAAQGKNSS